MPLDMVKNKHCDFSLSTLVGLFILRRIKLWQGKEEIEIVEGK